MYTDEERESVKRELLGKHADMDQITAKSDLQNAIIEKETQLHNKQFKVCIRFGFVLKIKNINQTKASEMMGINPNTLSRILLGKNFPSLLIILKMIETFDINPYWLLLGNNVPIFTEDVKKENSNMIDKRLLSDLAAELNTICKNISTAINTTD